MALIVLPSIEASGRPSPGDCMSAEAAILQQVGGVGPIAAKIVAGVNDYIDFTVGGGGELSARIAAGVYLSVAALLAACKTAMETAAAGAIVVTTTVQADRVVVTSSTAIAIKFSTGTHAAISARDLLGFGTIDTANGPTHTAAAPVPMELYAFAGGLDAANIAASAGFTNRHKREPWARSTVNIPITRFSGVPAVPTSACVPVNFMVERAALALGVLRVAVELDHRAGRDHLGAQRHGLVPGLVEALALRAQHQVGLAIDA